MTDKNSEPEGFSRLVKTADQFLRELKYRVWTGTYTRVMVDALDSIESRSHWLPGLVRTVTTIADELKTARQLLELEEDADEWATLAVLDSKTNFAMGHTVRVAPGQSSSVQFHVQTLFSKGSLYEVQTESPGIAITDARVGSWHMFGSASCQSDQGDVVSIRRGFLTHDCEVGMLLQFTLHNHRKAEDD